MILVLIFLCIIIILFLFFLVLLLSSIKLEIKDFELSNITEITTKDYMIKMSINLFGKIKIFSIKLNSNKLKKIYSKSKLEKINLKELIIKINKKIDLISGINLLFDSKYKISNFKINNIIQNLKQYYDVIIIDTSSACFLDYTKEIIKIITVSLIISDVNFIINDLIIAQGNIRSITISVNFFLTSLVIIPFLENMYPIIMMMNISSCKDIIFKLPLSL